MAAEIFDVIIIGAGIAGSCTAYQFAKQGKKVLLLEQFALDNDLNSSHGGSRIFRFAHEKAVLMPLAQAALPAWRQLEAEAQTELLRLSGFLWVGSHELTRKRAQNLAENGAECEVLSHTQLNDRFKHLKLDDRFSGLLDPNGGVLLANKCVAAAQKMAKKHGAIVRGFEPVVRIDPSPGKVDVFSTKSVYHCQKLVITAGPWLKKLVPDLPIKAEAQLMGVNYYKITSNHEYFDTEKGSPTLVIGDHIDPLIYALPDVDIPGHIKAAVHMGIRIHPDEPRKQPTWMQTYPNHHLNTVIKYVDFSAPAKISDCMYTVTEDEYFIIDKSPIHDNVFIAGGFSGYGFKFGLIVGEILTKMAYNLPVKYDLSHFKADRIARLKSKM